MPRPSAARWKWPSMPPLWPTKATPGFEPSPKRSASRANSMCSIMPSTLLVTPRQFGSDDGEAAVARGRRRPRPASPARRPRRSPRRTPSPSRPCACTQAATASRTPAAGSVKTARSTPSGSSSGLFSTGRPSIGSALRPTRWMSPLNLLSLSDCRMTWPALPARVDMPTIATDRGRRNLATAFGPRADSGPVISRPCPAATSADARRCRADASMA